MLQLEYAGIGRFKLVSGSNLLKLMFHMVAVVGLTYSRKAFRQVLKYTQIFCLFGSSYKPRSLHCYIYLL